jgi:molecular chaperone DnaJ
MVEKKMSKMQIRIPRGVNDGSRMEIKEKGHYVPALNQRGNVNIFFEVNAGDFFELDGPNILCVIPITLKQAVCGGKVTVPNPHGEVELTIPKKTKSGTIFRVKSKGMVSSPNIKNQFGDFFIKTEIDIPDVEDGAFNDDDFKYSEVDDYKKKSKKLSKEMKKAHQK